MKVRDLRKRPLDVFVNLFEVIRIGFAGRFDLVELHRRVVQPHRGARFTQHFLNSAAGLVRFQVEIAGAPQAVIEKFELLINKLFRALQNVVGQILQLPHEIVLLFRVFLDHIKGQQLSVTQPLNLLGRLQGFARLRLHVLDQVVVRLFEPLKTALTLVAAAVVVCGGRILQPNPTLCAHLWVLPCERAPLRLRGNAVADY